MEKHLADRTHQIKWSGIRIMLTLADQTPGVINLGIGQPDFDTPKFIREAAKQAIDEGYTRYPPAKGFEDLRNAIAEKLGDKNNIVADPNREIFVSVGAMQVIFNAVLHLINPGDEVIIMDPGYDYYSQIQLFRGVPVPITVYEANRFKPDPMDIEASITDKTKLIIINSPSNPTGAISDEAILRSIAQLAQEYDILVLSDEAYEDIIFDRHRHFSIGSLEGMSERTISVFTLSKSYAMTGWRVGYAVAPSIFIDEMEKLMEHMVSGVTSIAQRAALAALQAPQDCVREMVDQYDNRRQIIFKELNAIEGIKCLNPESTFYAFPNITGCGLTSWEFSKYLLHDHKVAVVPGTVFGQNGEGYVRVSFAADEEKLQEGIERIRQGIESLK